MYQKAGSRMVNKIKEYTGENDIFQAVIYMR